MMKKRMMAAVTVAFLAGTAVGGMAMQQLAAPAVRQAEAQEAAEADGVRALLWMQTAAEYRALCYQAYNDADREAERAAASHQTGAKPLAIVVDCDETIVDNTPMLAGKVLSGTQTNRWHPWVDTAGAQAMPGAVACLNHIADLGVEVFYVTNRTRSTSYQATVENLKKLGFPMVDDEHLFLREGTGSKEARFAQVAKDHEVVCYLGDSAGDWPLQTDGLDQAGRNAIIDQRAAAFGTKYIVLPNPAYGAWESVLPHEADGRRNALHIWQPAQ